MIDNKKFAIAFIVGFILLTLVIGLNNERFIEKISTAKIGEALLYYFISRIDYVIIFSSIFLLRISTPIKEFFAGLTLILAIDILSFPRLPSDAMTAVPSLMANSDYIFMKHLISFTNWNYTFAWKFYYIFMPIFLILLVGYILGLVKLGKRITNS